MASSSSDVVTLNVGGRRFTTTTATLTSSGAAYFEALLLRWMPGANNATASKVTPCNTRKRAREENEEVESQKSELFVDCDPDIFGDILYFMRRQVLKPSVLADPCTLLMLKTEGEFLAYDALIQACEKQLKILKGAVQATLKDQADRKRVYSDVVNARPLQDADHEISLTVSNGQVLYLSHAVLGGLSVRRYAKGDEDTVDIPGCYLDTCKEEDSGDFRLCFTSKTNGVRTHNHYDLAHIGKDHIHCGKRPLDMDFSVPVHRCFFTGDDDEMEVKLYARGAASWQVHYYIGYPEAIPFLNHPGEGESTIVSSQWMKSFKHAREEVLADEDGDSTQDHETAMLAMVGMSAVIAAHIISRR